MKHHNPPYYAVIFTSALSNHTEGYNQMAENMARLAKQQKGFLGMSSARNNIGIIVSYWESLAAIKQWKLNSQHLLAKQQGKSQWYAWYNVKICKVEQAYEFGELTAMI